MNFDHAFIITYGRSGSTLLQGILNTIPGACIHGENGNILFFISRIGEGLRMSQRFAPVADSPTHPWFGAQNIPHESFLDDLVAKFKLDIMPKAEAHTLIGFKEIRFHIPYPQLEQYISFIRRNFSRSAIVFNTRDLDAVMESNRRAKHLVVEDRVRDADANFRRYAAQNPDFCHLVHYDDYTRNPELLRGLFDFLGAEFDADSVAQTMAQTHSVRTSVNAG